ncbi:hypothetical protein HMPREF0980_02962 [Dorea sp. D27]|nr:hypothetical protein HMPREF0980_02962 [Dorea sp. D27]
MLTSIHSTQMDRDLEAVKNLEDNDTSIHSTQMDRDAGLARTALNIPYFNPLYPNG